MPDLNQVFFNHSPIAIMDWQRSGCDLMLIQQNGVAIALTSGLFKPGDLLGEVSPEHWEANESVGEPLLAWYVGALATGKVRKAILRFHSSSSALDGWWENTSIPSPCGNFLRMEFRNVTEAEIRLREQTHRALTDQLTQIPNRRAYDIKLQEWCDRHSPFALAIIDLNGFKRVNDDYGHGFGDELLKAIAQKLSAAMHGSGDHAFRLGGDEFAVLIEGDGELDAVGQRLDSIVRSPCTIQSNLYYPSAAIGLAAYESGDQPDSLYLYADESQRRAKQRIREARDSIDSFTPHHWWVCDRANSYIQLHQEFVGQMAAPTSLQLHYQPILNLHTEAVMSYEGLIRWLRPGGAISPPQILDLVARYQLGVDFCLWTIEQAHEQWKRWGCPDQKIAINVSPSWLESEVLLRAFVETEGVSAEITEDQLLEAPRVLNSLHHLRDENLYVSWDDFGTKCAVIAGLASLQVDAIKLDRTLTQNPAIIRGVATMLKEMGLNLNLVAEGIETEEQRQYCAQFVDYGQGWLFGKPMPGEAIAPFNFQAADATD